MLPVGIHDNVVVSKAEINEQGTLEIEFKQPGANNALEALTGDAELTPERSVNIRIYPQNVEYFGERRDGTKMLSLITNFRAVLTELLKVYIPNPDIQATKGLTVTQDNVNTVFGDQANVDVAYKNITTQFVEQITPFINSDTKFRVKLPRRSKKYAFASLPNFTPWVESMDIPKESSKLKWSQWEIDNGKNSSTPATDTADDSEVSQQLEELNDVFNEQG